MTPMALLSTVARRRFGLERPIVRALTVLCVVGLISAGCSLKEQRNPDPRAYADSASDVTLEQALADNGIRIPESAREIRFAVYIGRDDTFDLMFDADCSAISRFLVESSIEAPLRSSVLLPSLVETAGREHGWNIESYRDPRGIEDDRLGAVLRSVIVASTSEHSCKVFVSTIR